MTRIDRAPSPTEKWLVLTPYQTVLFILPFFLCTSLPLSVPVRKTCLIIMLSALACTLIFNTIVGRSAYKRWVKTVQIILLSIIILSGSVGAFYSLILPDYQDGIYYGFSLIDFILLFFSAPLIFKMISALYDMLHSQYNPKGKPDTEDEQLWQARQKRCIIQELSCILTCVFTLYFTIPFVTNISMSRLIGFALCQLLEPLADRGALHYLGNSWS